METSTPATRPLSINSRELDLGAHAFGALSVSDPSDDPAVLRARLDDEGYAFFPGFFRCSESTDSFTTSCSTRTTVSALCSRRTEHDVITAVM